MMAVMAGTAAVAQGSIDCPGFRNPTSFSAGDNLYYFWSARVGERCYPQYPNDTTTGYYIMSTCPSAPEIRGHNNITSSTYNSGSPESCGYTFFDGNDTRFQILGPANAGIDQYTVAPGSTTGMPRIPTGYTHSIRLGDMHSTGNSYAATTHTWSSSHSNKGSEALFYTMRVTPMNALLIINYAVVARRYSHSAYDAGEFLIRIVKQNDDGTWPNAPINDDLWYKVSAPTFTGSEMPAGWQVGAGDVTNWPCTYAYKPWTKVAISLSQYLYENVRVEMYTSDCIYSADPIYAYIAGDYQNMLILSSGCADAQSEAIDTLTAPEGLNTYTWFVAERGQESNIFNPLYMDTIPFRQVSATSTSNVYIPTIADFIVTQGPDAGDTIPTQTFLCSMTSALDPHKPFVSKVYANVDNQKPIAHAQIDPDCDLNIQFSNRSYGFGSDVIDVDSTRWIVYSDSLCTSVLDTLWGESVSYHFPEEGYYKVRLHVSLFSRDCGSERTFLCRALQSHPIPIIADTLVCEGETATAYCTEHLDIQKEWLIGDSLLRPYAGNPRDTVSWVPDLGLTAVQLTTYTDSLCPATTTATVKCLGNVQISTTLDHSVLCLGDSAILSATGIGDPMWTSVPYDTLLDNALGHDTVVISPSVTTVYYVQPSRPTRCVQNPSTITVTVLPYPQPSIWTSRSYVDIINPTLLIEDRSLNSTNAYWTFSDGQSAEGARVEHYFNNATDSVTIALHACNDDRCCADTSLSLPVHTDALWIPNVFAPGDPGNDIFRFVTNLDIIEFEIYIYNRQGLLVYHGTDFNAGWDGKTAAGTPCPQGAYAYQYSYVLADTPTHKHVGIGTVTLLR